jgi:hypothetical protein
VVRHPDAEVRRWSADIAILASLGRFFAGKLRSAVAYEAHVATGDPTALVRAVEAYRVAREAWAQAVERADGVYVRDLTYGPQARIRGHWADRLAAIDADLADMEDVVASGTSGVDVAPLLDPASTPPTADVDHEPPAMFEPGEPIDLSLRVRGADVRSVTVRYRPMNQALAFSAHPLERSGDRFEGSIPEEATRSGYPLAYAFVLRGANGDAWRHPGLGADLASQPYFTVGSWSQGAGPAGPRAR